MIRESIGPKFREIFDSKEKPDKIPNTDLYIIAGVIVLLVIVILIRNSRDVITSWPPLSGLGGTLTDIFFYVVAAVLSLLSIYILIRTIKWATSLKKNSEKEK